MGKTLKYVKDFDFESAGKTVGLCGGGMVRKAYAKGGMHQDAKADKQMVKAAVHKHEKAMHKGAPLTKLAKGGMMKPEVKAMSKREMMSSPTVEKTEVIEKQSVKAPAGKGMMGRRRMPVAPKEPMIQPLKYGGMAKKKC